jgi:hypothetical protein
VYETVCGAILRCVLAEILLLKGGIRVEGWIVVQIFNVLIEKSATMRKTYPYKVLVF